MEAAENAYWELANKGRKIQQSRQIIYDDICLQIFL